MISRDTSGAVFEPGVSAGQNREASSPGFRRWLPFAILGVLWLGLINHLRLEWSVNDQYSYGFAVPFLALYLFAQRWKSAPLPQKPGRPNLALGIIAVGCVLLFPLHLVEEANPEWRFVSWSLAIVVVGISLALLLYRAGWPWTRHFLFPVCFILTAVPWPSAFEGSIIQFLMQLDASVAVEMLKWLGIPALCHGNVIDLAGASVGIDEACSGIRSLQNTLMISLFLGELYRLTFLRRAILVFSAAAIAFFCNLGRTFFLAWVTARHGSGIMEKWHDRAGFLVLAISLAGLLGVTFILRRDARGQTYGSEAYRKNKSFHPWPTRFLIVVAAWLLFVVVGTESWYRLHEIHVAHAPMWSIVWPTNQTGFQDVSIPATTHALLKYTEGRHASWQENGTECSAFFFRWAPGRTARIAARWHHPDVCLSAVGCQLQADEGVRLYQVQGLEIPFHGYVFNQSGRQLHVWQCIWDDETNSISGWTAAANTSAISNRVQAVLRGRRNLGQQVFELAVWSAETSRETDAMFRTLLPRLVEPVETSNRSAGN